MKIIFLDCDYVLNDVNTENTYTIRDGKYTGVDEEKIALLKRIIDLTGAKIVISSTWRLYAESMKYLREKMGDELSSSIIDSTEKLNAYRYLEIKLWLDEHPGVKVFAVIDDSYVDKLTNFDESFFMTDYKSGLTEEIAGKIIYHLNNNSA